MHNAIAPAPAKKTAAKVSLRTARTAIARHPFVFTALVLASAGVAAGVWFLMPLPKHTATALFQLSGHAPRVISASSENQVDVRTYGNLQAATIRRRQVLMNALKNPEMEKVPQLAQQADKIGWLSRILQIDFQGGPDFMRIYVEGDQPEELLAILRAVSAAYLAAVADRDNEGRKSRLALLEKAIGEQQAILKPKAARVDTIAQTLGMPDAMTLAMVDIGNSHDMLSASNEYQKIQQKLAFLDSEFSRNQADPPPVVVAPAVLDDAVRQDPAMVQAEAKVAGVKQLLQDTEARFEPGIVNPIITKAKQEVKTAEENRDKIKADLRMRHEVAIKRQVETEARLRMARQKEDYDQLVREGGRAKARIEEVEARVKKYGVYRAELDQFRKEMGSTERMLASLTDERDHIKIEKDAPPRVSADGEPFVQSGVEGMRRLRTVLIASGGLFVVGFAVLIWLEHRGRRVMRTDDLAHSAGLTVLGTIPVVKPNDPLTRHLLVEAVDSLRTQLLQARTHERPIRTVLVTSGLSGEGKTTLCGHVSISLARAGYRVLMIDGDLHAPTAHRLFDLPLTPGFCEVLRGEAIPTDAVRSTPVPGMFIMTAGDWNMAARQCLVGDRWGLIRDQLQTEFDFLIVDSAPLLLMADTLLLAKATDGAVISVLLGTSRLGAIGLTHERLETMGVRVLGAVVNGAVAEYANEYNSDYYGRSKFGSRLAALDSAPSPIART